MPSDPERCMVVLLCGKYHRTQRNPKKPHHNKSHSKNVACCVLCVCFCGFNANSKPAEETNPRRGAACQRRPAEERTTAAHGVPAELRR